MTKKQFLDAVNEIDDEFINELIDIPDSSRENYFADDKPQVVYLTSERIPFWKIAVSAVAAVCVLTAGIFAMVKLRGIQTYNPNESMLESSSYIQSETSSIPDKLDTVLTDGFDFSCLSPYISYQSHTVEKNDDENYAVVYISCQGISEENPLFISVMAYHDRERVYAGTLIVSENDTRTYRIDYEEDVKKGDRLCLYMAAKTDAPMRADGKWLP